ncbi:ATP-binding protein, partial [Shigella sonnei]|nr:ATP-binding protein [Shigella sonnei]
SRGIRRGQGYRLVFQFPIRERNENIVLLGPSGVGKTHLAIAMGYEAFKIFYDISKISLELYHNIH